MRNGRQRRLILIGAVFVLALVLAILNWDWLVAWMDQNGVVLRQAIVTGLLIGGVFGLVAMGLTLIFGVLDIINFAHGALLTIGMYITFVLFNRFGIDPYLAILITVPLLFLLGIVIHRQPARCIQQAALANARFALNQQHARESGARNFSEYPAEPFQLLISSHQGFRACSDNYRG